ncbi:MAG: DedA family protein [Acidobacteria bacterium]|nr:DedA family protein [Acidobacteriota bacterium]MXZ72120.1 DedA family protein [Acidobacteriota bacterium]MYD70870.1 DedA family protein [Acidobacteriota bacterium]MYJ05182.1 DedA family protein [Acidobacteriota bacterium]
MTRIVAWVQAFALGIGGPGLFLVAFLDSSFLSLPEINDLLVVLLVVGHPERMPFYALMATLGSVTGCLVLYSIGKRGGEALVRRRFSGPRVERALELSRRYGVLAIAVPSILPPPAPFKIFVLLAGVAAVPVWKFTVTLAVARGFRYLTVGVLSILYGEEAIGFIEENGRAVALAIAVLIVVGAAGWLLWRRRTQNAARAGHL